MYRSDHVLIAKALRDASEDADLNDSQRSIFVKHFADVCQERTPSAAKFDREMFYAYALSPSLPRE